VSFFVILFATSLLYCIVLFGALHLLGEIFGVQLDIMLGIIAGVVILTIVSVVGVKGWLGARSKAAAKAED